MCCYVKDKYDSEQIVGMCEEIKIRELCGRAVDPLDECAETPGSGHRYFVINFPPLTQTFDARLFLDIRRIVFKNLETVDIYIIYK